ncbi:MAG TPA: hypothetical protein VG455_08905, partial [Acidimicrobiales bacterium]|nr:hypothetical protein [Acidimicrobiales bacterium]
ARSGAAAAADAGVGDRTEQLDQAAVEEAVATDDGFPIHNYDRLRATEILPMLAELDDEQLAAVRRREESGKKRFMIMSRIDDEMQSRSPEVWEVDEETWEEEVEVEVESEPVAAGGPGPVPAAPRAPTGEFPIPDYDSLRALDILGRLSDLSPGELQQVREREQSGARRAMVLNRIDRILEETGPMPAEPLVVPPPEPTPARGRGRARAATAPAAKKAGGRAAKRSRAAKAAVPPEPAKKARTRKAAEVPPIPTKRAGVKRGAVTAPAGPETAEAAAPATRAAKATTARKTAGAKKAGAKKTVTAKKTVAAKKSAKAAGATKKAARKR